MKVTRFRCVECGKLTTGRLPKGSWENGDGTGRFPRRHNGADGKPCHGNIEEAEWVDVEVMPPADAWTRGYMCAVATIARHTSDTTMTDEALVAVGCETTAYLEGLCLEAVDADVLRPHVAALEARRASPRAPAATALPRSRE